MSVFAPGGHTQECCVLHELRQTDTAVIAALISTAPARSVICAKQKNKESEAKKHE
jgi:hypothetical protein